MSSFILKSAKLDLKNPSIATAQQFATTVQAFQLNNADANIFQVVEEFKSITATFALNYGDFELNHARGQPVPTYVTENLQNFDLETKL